MSTADKAGLREAVNQFLAGQDPDTCMTRVEFHGLLCAMACGPETDLDWQAISVEAPIPDDIRALMETWREQLASKLGLGESVQLPCRLDPHQDDDGNDLASWCAGFMAGVFLNEAAWYERDEELMASRLLPFVVISGVDDDPELDAIWENNKLVRQMATLIPELLQEIFLHFHAPEMAEDDTQEQS